MSVQTQPEHGVKAVRDAVARLLRADLPFRIDRMTQLWQLDRGQIPDPDMITSGETPDNALDHRGTTNEGEDKYGAWVEVITPRLLPRTRTVEVTARGSSVNRYRYSARLYVWTLAPSWAEAIDRRDRLAVAVRDSLFSYPTLAVPPAVGDTGFLINSSTISEEYGEPHRIGRGNTRVWAPALLTYEIDHEYDTEAITTRDDWGSFDGVDLLVTLLPWDRPATEG
jgi:hypothetical protein